MILETSINDELAAWDRGHFMHPTTHVANHARGDAPGRIITGGDGVYDCIVGAVAHDLYGRFTTDSFSKMVAPGGLVADIKGLWRHIDLPEGMRRWNL